jgi:hypothetical protein
MKLSILIPSLNEPHIYRTLDDIEQHKTADTEVLWREDDGRGQRATTNELCRRAQGEYIMKTDAHCSFSKGFDTELLKVADEKTIVAPFLLGLDPERWEIKYRPAVGNYCFDQNLVMQYDKEREDLLVETMCLQGSAWLVSKKTYWDWNLGDETLGSWGGQGVELGIKAWLNGGRCITNKHAYYGHLFREKEEDFPYQRDKAKIKGTTDEILRRFKNQSIAGLIRKFGYPADWTQEAVDALPEVVS